MFQPEIESNLNKIEAAAPDEETIVAKRTDKATRSTNKRSINIFDFLFKKYKSAVCMIFLV